jgi:hypothetical protein
MAREVFKEKIKTEDVDVQQEAVEEFQRIQESLEWQMKVSANRKRLVCSQTHFDEMMAILNVCTKQCANPKCKHTKNKHKEGFGMCGAVRCKCWEFKDDSPPDPNDSVLYVPTVKDHEFIAKQGALHIINEAIKTVDSAVTDEDGKSIKFKLGRIYDYVNDSQINT